MLREKNIKVYLHIGLYKCASTSIQNNLINKINNRNIYTFTPSKNNFYNFAFEKYSNNYDQIFEYRNHILSIQKKIIELFNNIKGERKLIISEEGFFGHQSNCFNDVEKRFKIMEDCFDKPNYIIAFRNQSSILKSSYFQSLRKGNQGSFVNYVNKKIDNFDTQKENTFFESTNYKCYDFNKIFKNYIDIKSRTLFLNIDQKNSQYIYKKIFNFLDLDQDMISDKVLNKSVKQNLYLNFFNKYLIFKILKSIFFNLDNFFIKNKNKHPIENIFITNLIKIYKSIFKLFKIESFRLYEQQINDKVFEIDNYFINKNKIFFDQIND